MTSLLANLVTCTPVIWSSDGELYPYIGLVSGINHVYNLVLVTSLLANLVTCTPAIWPPDGELYPYIGMVSGINHVYI